MTQFLFVLFMVVGMLLASGSAEAQLAKRGTYTSHFTWQAVTKASEIDKDHTFVSGEWVGINFNDASQGFLHAVAGVCPGSGDIVKRVATFSGYCTFTDKDGDKAFSRWQCRNPDVGVRRCEGDFQWMGGTGKYTGLTGGQFIELGRRTEDRRGLGSVERGVASARLRRCRAPPAKS
jgi:hypothetical protein